MPNGIPFEDKWATMPSWRSSDFAGRRKPIDAARDCRGMMDLGHARSLLAERSRHSLEPDPDGLK